MGRLGSEMEMEMAILLIALKMLEVLKKRCEKGQEMKIQEERIG